MSQAEVDLQELSELAAAKGTSLSMINIEISWSDGNPEVLAQADLDKGEGEEYETVLYESKAKSVNAALLKIKQLIEGMNSGREETAG